MKKENPNKDMARRLAQKIAAMSDAERAEFAARCPVVLTIDGRPISGKNAMLAAMQCQTVTIVGGFRQWLAAGRAVRQGEKGIYIFVPSSRKSEPGADAGAEGAADSGESIRFLMAAVFDVSQTDAVEIETANAA
jgi:antirestriction protein ArdC